MKATIVVPHGNSAEKNAAMRALGAELVEEVAQAITILFQCTHNCASPT
jgi:threonine dehydratase